MEVRMTAYFDDILCGSDTTSGVSKQILNEICKVANVKDFSYGEDNFTKKSFKKFQQVFNKEDIIVIPMLTGTGSNALALSLLNKNQNNIICHKNAHILNSECNASEFYCPDSNLISLDGNEGKLTSSIIDKFLKKNNSRKRKVAGISISQLTEYGTSYSIRSLKEIGEVCKKYNIFFHMDGARFSNALSYLNVKPSEMTWEVGLDCLSLGATKNGAFAAEAIVVFNVNKVNNWNYYHKRSGNALPKTKFISSQFISWFRNGLWIKLSHVSNNAATSVANYFLTNKNFRILYPVQGNEIFVEVNYLYYKKIIKKKIFPKLWARNKHTVILRFVFGFDTNNKMIKEIIKRLNSI